MFYFKYCEFCQDKLTKNYMEVVGKKKILGLHSAYFSWVNYLNVCANVNSLGVSLRTIYRGQSLRFTVASLAPNACARHQICQETCRRVKLGMQRYTGHWLCPPMLQGRELPMAGHWPGGAQQHWPPAPHCCSWAARTQCVQLWTITTAQYIFIHTYISIIILCFWWDIITPVHL